jgi:indoleamine 2,3-dioxygenase
MKLLFSIDLTRGFLPVINPDVSLLPLSDFNIELNRLVQRLPELIRNKSLRVEINRLNDKFDSQHIIFDRCNLQQQNVAILILLMLAQAYVWEVPESPVNCVPAVIAKNLYTLCKQSQRFPMLTYADYVLQNWRLIDSAKPISLDNIEPLFTFTGTLDEAWFVKIHVIIEAVCGKALHAAGQIASLTYEAGVLEEIKLCEYLNEITYALQEATAIIERMIEGCHPDVYWDVIRHYLNGWDKVKSNHGIEKTGVKFDGIMINNKEVMYQFKGPSGAQSSVIPALDAVLGVKHHMDGMYQTLLMFQQYMPSQSQLYISLLKQYSIEKWLESECSIELKNKWQQAVDQLKLFRLSHLKLVAQYIHHPAEKQGVALGTITGTGGSALDQYLKSRYESTV